MGTELPLVTLFALGVAAAALGLFGLLGGVIPSRRVRAVASILAVFGLVVFAVTAVALGWPPYVWLPPQALAGVCGLFLATRSRAVRRTGQLLAWATWPFLQWGALLAVGLTLILWCLWRAEGDAGAAGPTDHRQAQRERAMDSLREVTSTAAETDRGRRIRLFTMPEHALPPAMLREMEGEMAQEWGLGLRLIRTSPPDRQSDCHGWVFTGGRWWMLGADVEAILRDNAYQPVSEPEAGDLVVYRDGPETITHSGVVFAAPPSGAVLVESKWAWLGTYLHAPQAHPYGGQPFYYRSSRAGHQLTLVSTGP